MAEEADKVPKTPVEENDENQVPTSSEASEPKPSAPQTPEPSKANVGPKQVIRKNSKRSFMQEALKLEASKKQASEKLDKRKRLTKLTHDQKLMKQYFESDAAKVRERINKSKLLEQRLAHMATSSKEIQLLLTNHVKYVNHDRVNLADDVKKMSVCTKTPSSSIEEGVTSFHQYLTNSDSYKAFFGEHVKPVLLKITALTNELSKTRSIEKARSVQLSKELLIRRKACETTWDAYWKAMSRSGVKQLEHDPYLTGRLFDRKTEDYTQIQKAYTEQMGNIFENVLKKDTDRLNTQKAIMLDYLMTMKDYHRQEIVKLDKVLDNVSRIDAEADVKAFVTQGAFYQPLYSNDDKTPIFKVPLHFMRNQDLVQSIHKDVALAGKIFRPGKIISSNWKPVYAIITRHGFFHYFQNESDEIPALTIKLVDSYVLMNNDRRNVFELSLPSASWMSFASSTDYLFRCETQEVMIDWIVELQKYCSKKVQSPSVAL